MKKNKNLSMIIITFLLTLVLITSMMLQFKTVEKNDREQIEDLRDIELKSQIVTYKEKYDEVLEKYKTNLNKIKEYHLSADKKEKAENLIEEEYKKSNELLGLTDVEGEGIVIILSGGEFGNPTSEDLRNLVNELRFAGAEAISINDNRVVNLTDIVTLRENFIIINSSGNRIVAPFTIKAIGNKKYLSSTLNTKTTGSVDLLKSNGFDVKVEEFDKVKILKYNGTFKTEYIKGGN